jgi:hypothetical protein
MELGRYKVKENMIDEMIRDGDDDVTSLFLNNSDEGDEQNRRDGSNEGNEQDQRDGSSEGEGDGSDEGEGDGSDEGEAKGFGGTLNITKSGEVYILINYACAV